MEEIFIQLSSRIAEGVSSRLETAIGLAPRIFGAVALFLFGWILAEMAYRMIMALGHKIKLEVISDKLGLKHFLERHKFKITSTGVVAKGVKGYLIFVFFLEATKVAKLTAVSEFLSVVYSYIPDVIVAILIMLVGIRVGNTLHLLISTSLSFAKSNTAEVLGIAAKYVIFTFAVLAALSQLEIAEILIQILFAGFIAMLTISGGLAFGLGGKDLVHELLEDIKKVELREIRKEVKKELKKKK